MDAKTVKPKDARGYNMSPIAQMFGSGLKWTITCGECEFTFKKRIAMISHQGLKCPNCRAINVIELELTRPYS